MICRNSKHCVPVSDVLNSCRTGDVLLMKGKNIVSPDSGLLG